MAVYSLMPGSMYVALMAPLLKVAPSSLMQPPQPFHSVPPDHYTRVSTLLGHGLIEIETDCDPIDLSGEAEQSDEQDLG